jgi:hypothetical protein
MPGLPRKEEKRVMQHAMALQCAITSCWYFIRLAMWCGLLAQSLLANCYTKLLTTTVTLVTACFLLQPAALMHAQVPSPAELYCLKFFSAYSGRPLCSAPHSVKRQVLH